MPTVVPLEAPRLRLRALAMDDAAAVAAYGSDPEVSRYVSWPRHRSIEDAHAFLRYAIAAAEEGRELIWAIVEHATGTVIGTVGLRLQGHRVELGYALAQRHWGRGFATEAAARVVAWALAQRDIYRVWAVCDVENVASARVLEKIGLEREGRLRGWAVMPSLGAVPRDCWCYARLK